MKRARNALRAMPLWMLDNDAGTRPARSATVIPFPAAATRDRRIVTYPARIGLPPRTARDDGDVPAHAWHAALVLAGIVLLLLVTLLHAQ